ncbi:glycine receptor beta [Nesidiocoris tenuis]|uniref:Glycine receptor beta n=1 Tax=Nesidiocoris tenuis TaxID=355587 RepID=A0ABN7AVJ4_9HEMI|nr:glycine receptor beta [Nesidiocoris tenuis]
MSNYVVIVSAKNIEVSISLFINRVSAVEESKEEISLEVFLQVYWEDTRINITEELPDADDHLELTWDTTHVEEQKFWIPDLYIRQLRDMKVLSLFQEMTSVRIYRNQTMRISIGATVQIKCDMDFVLYPLDVQKCAVDFSSYKYTIPSMTFKWRDDPPLSFPSDFGKDGYRLPKYVVSFRAEEEQHIVYYGEGNHSTARMLITMSRELRSHLLESYLPSTLFVIMSWGSFVVMPEVVPGRMVLLVTTLLSLVTMFDTIRNNSPSALELKCIEVWLISCTLFVFFALLEYFIVLFGIRYDKHWRHKKQEIETFSITNHVSNKERLRGMFQHPKVSPQESHANTNNATMISTNLANATANAANTANSVANSHSHPVANSKDPSPVQNDIAAHATSAAKEPIEVDGNLNPEAGRVGLDPASTVTGKQKFQLLTKHVILYVGSQRGTIDQISLGLFPLCFLLFSITYWISYISESKRRASA